MHSNWYYIRVEKILYIDFIVKSFEFITVLKFAKWRDNTDVKINIDEMHDLDQDNQIKA